uniref:Uncharacterized protein n=3 Tax=Oryza TaxID=4527 RepID=A0A0D3F8I1_9ORYZ
MDGGKATAWPWGIRSSERATRGTATPRSLGTACRGAQAEAVLPGCWASEQERARGAALMEAFGFGTLAQQLGWARH